MMRHVRLRIVRIAAAVAGLAVAMGIGAWAQAKKAGADVEGQIQRAGFTYYYATAFGDADSYMKVTRMPLYAVRDGVGAYRDEKQTRAMLARLAEHVKSEDLTADDRARVVKNMIALFDQASVQFVGANTATLTFLIKRGATEKEGDHLGTLTLYQKDGAWKVIAELTDSTAVPPDYVKGP